MREHGEGSGDPNPNLRLVAEEHQVFFVIEVRAVSEPREILTELIGLEYLIVSLREHSVSGMEYEKYIYIQHSITAEYFHTLKKT